MRWSSRQGDGQLTGSSPGPEAYTTCVDVNVEGAPESHVATSTLVEAARLEYSKAKNEFWQFGDREAHYLQADILNAELISTDVDFEGSTRSAWDGDLAIS
jgi:hypothetical protein